MDITNTINQLGIQINTLEEELGSKSNEYINWRRKLNILKTRLSINIQQNNVKLYNNIDVVDIIDIIDIEERSSYIE